MGKQKPCPTGSLSRPSHFGQIRGKTTGTAGKKTSVVKWAAFLGFSNTLTLPSISSSGTSYSRLLATNPSPSPLTHPASLLPSREQANTPAVMSGVASRVSSLVRSEAAREWQTTRRACLPTCKLEHLPYSITLLTNCTVSTITQSRSYRSSPPNAAYNQYNQYITPAERAKQRKSEQENTEARAMDRNFSREWKSGDVYAPHDLSAAEARKWRKRYTPMVDAFDALSLNPLDFYKVGHIIKNSMGGPSLMLPLRTSL